VLGKNCTSVGYGDGGEKAKDEDSIVLCPPSRVFKHAA
jgi:hypothetical protein